MLREETKKARLNGQPALVKISQVDAQAYLILPQTRTVAEDGSVTYHTNVLSARDAYRLGHHLEILNGR